MSYLDRLKQKFREDAPQGEATKGTKAPFVPFVAPLPTPSRQISYREAFEERAAIMEFDGGLTREEAERLARAEFGAMGAR
jgi:hypothetical protein